MSKGKMPIHKQVRIKHPDGRQIKVDEGLAPLLSSLWSLEIETEFSCQQTFEEGQSGKEEPTGPMWIAFSFSHDAEEFLDILYRSLNPNGEDWSEETPDTPEGAKWERVTGYWPTRDKPKDIWTYGVHLVIEEGLGPILRPSIDFPVTDYPWVLEVCRQRSGAVTEVVQ